MADQSLAQSILSVLMSSPNPEGRGLLQNVADLSAQRNNISPLGILMALGGSPAGGSLAMAAGPTIRAQLPRLQSTPIVRINGENYVGYTHEGALERAAQARGMNETVKDLVDGLGGWDKVRSNHFGYLDAADKFVPMPMAMDPTKYR